MPIYSFRLEMAWNENENEVWALYRRLQVIAKKSPIQINSFTLLRNGREFSRSLEEYKLEERRRLRTEAERRVATARDELRTAAAL